MDTASSKPDDLLLPVAAGEPSPAVTIKAQIKAQIAAEIAAQIAAQIAAEIGAEIEAQIAASAVLAGPAAVLLEELWVQAEAESCGLSRAGFGQVLASAGARLNHNLPPGKHPDANQKAAFYRSLHVAELALAHACALGRLRDRYRHGRALDQHRRHHLAATLNHPFETYPTVLRLLQ